MPNFVNLLSCHCFKKFNKISFLGESRLEKDIVKSESYIFFQKDPSSSIQYVKVENLNVILHQEAGTASVDQNFILLYDLQGVSLKPTQVSYRPTQVYFDCLKFLNKQEIQQFPLLVIPNKNIQAAAWKFTRKQPQINKIYARNISIRMIDNLPISNSSEIILDNEGNGMSEDSFTKKFEDTYFKIYEVVSKIDSSSSISLSLEVYKSLSSLKNIIELVAGINLVKLSVFIKSYDYDKNQEDHIFLTKILKTCKTLKNFKFNGYRFNNLSDPKKVEAKKLIDHYFVQEELISYTPIDVWDVADFETS